MNTEKMLKGGEEEGEGASNRVRGNSQAQVKVRYKNDPQNLGRNIHSRWLGNYTRGVPDCRILQIDIKVIANLRMILPWTSQFNC